MAFTRSEYTLRTPHLSVQSTALNAAFYRTEYSLRTRHLPIQSTLSERIIYPYRVWYILRQSSLFVKGFDMYSYNDAAKYCISVFASGRRYPLYHNTMTLCLLLGFFIVRNVKFELGTAASTDWCATTTSDQVSSVSLFIQN